MAADLGRLTATIEARAERFDLVLQRASQRLDRIAGETERANSRIARSTRSLDGVAASAARSFRAFATSLVGFGGTTAIAAGINRATDQAIEFERTFSRIVGLAGESEEAIEGLRQGVFDLAGETGRGPQELAEALFFVESSGFAGAEALDVLTSAANAARAGLGETKTIADAITSALDVYGKEALSAAEATDIMVAAVREGKGEADALASVFGRVLPVSKALGVSFGETAGAVAALTRTGLSADEAATSIRGALTAILKPSEEARKALEGVGLSLEDVRETIEQDGLLAALQKIDTALGGNREALAQVFPEVRGLVGVLSLLGTNSEKTRAIIDSVVNSVGATGDAVSQVADDIGDSLDRANARLATASTQLGEAFGPAKARLVNLFADAVSGLSEVAGTLDESTVERWERLAKSVAAFFLSRFPGDPTAQYLQGLLKASEETEKFERQLQGLDLQDAAREAFQLHIGDLSRTPADELRERGSIALQDLRDELQRAGAELEAGIREREASLAALRQRAFSDPDAIVAREQRATGERAVTAADAVERLQRQQELAGKRADEYAAALIRVESALDSGSEGAGEAGDRLRVLTDEQQRARQQILQDHTNLVASMRESSLGALSEAQQLSLQLADTLAKIGEAAQQGVLSAGEAAQFQRAAIEEAAGAISAAEERALRSQAENVQSFLRKYGEETLSEAQRISLQLADQLNQLAEQGRKLGLTPQQIGEAAGQVTAASQPAFSRAAASDAANVAQVQRDLLRLQGEIESGSLFGLSRSLQRELEASEARLDASQLEQKIREAYRGGDPAEMDAALAENQRLLEDRLADIENSWDETIGSIAEIGEDTLGDFFEGIAQGADASFEDLARSFLLRLAEMEARAIAADLVGAITGRGADPTSITDRLVGEAADFVTGGDGEDSAKKAEQSAVNISTQLFGALERGAGALLDAGSGAGQAIAGASSAILNAGLQAAAAIVQALAAAGAASLGFLGLKEGGAVTQHGVLRLPALADGGIATQSFGGVASLESLSNASKLSVPSFPSGILPALVGEAGTERLLRIEQIREIAAGAKGDPVRAAWLAKQEAVVLDRPEIRALTPGDIVIPDRKLRGFFDRVMPPKLAEGGFRPLDAFASVEGAVASSESGLSVNITMEQTSGPAMSLRTKRVERRGAQVNIATELFVTAMRRGGDETRELESRYPVVPTLRQPG